MTHEATKTSTRRVRFADSVGRELVTIFLVDLISNFYSYSIQSNKNPFHHRAIEAAKKSLALPSPPPNISYSSSTSYSPPTTTTATSPSANLNLHHHHQQHYQHYENHSTTTNNNNLLEQHSLSSHHSASPTSQTTSSTTHHSFSFRYSPLKSTHQQLSTTTATTRVQNLENEKREKERRKENFICDFIQPISLISFKERVRLNKVHLETCQINNFQSSTTIIKANFLHSNQQQQQQVQISYNNNSTTITTALLSETLNQPLISISCTVRVLNLSYEKSVILRYTIDDWHTTTDCLATYKPGSCDGWSDKFIATFTIQQPQPQPLQQRAEGAAAAGNNCASKEVRQQNLNNAHSAQQLQRIKFAIKYVSKQEVFWDNNGGLNYIIKREDCC